MAAHITAPQSKSSQKICDAQWKEWLSWAEQNQVNPLHPTLTNVTSYLHYLFRKGLAVQTIAGHKSMMASALKFHTELDLIHSKELTRHEWPPASNLVPKWD